MMTIDTDKNYTSDYEEVSEDAPEQEEGDAE